MAKIPLPERGQPLDVTYVYSLASAVNDIAASVSSSTYNYLSLDVAGSNQPQNVKTSAAKIIGGLKSVTSLRTVTTGEVVDFEYDYADFKFPPSVTITPINETGKPAGKNVSVVINQITTTKVTGLIRFNESGEVQMAISLLIIGIPN
jgi:hypothetical protein